jgi:hypothetical protein
MNGHFGKQGKGLVWFAVALGNRRARANRQRRKT